MLGQAKAVGKLLDDASIGRKARHTNWRTAEAVRATAAGGGQQTKRRVLHGEAVRASEKLVSIFEPRRRSSARASW